MPGVMGALSTVLGKNNVNIESAHASIKSQGLTKKISFVHFFTAISKENQIQKSIDEIKKLKVIRGSIKLFIILGDQNNE
jgi:uncharacterized protein with ACT and thioredoxin-like domain